LGARKAQKEGKRSAGLSDVPGKPPPEVGILLRLPELLKFLEAAPVEPLDVGEKRAIVEKRGQVAIFVGFSSAAQSGPMSR
jgi:hypothetical protein